jgi:hypothetical protein
VGGIAIFGVELEGRGFTLVESLRQESFEESLDHQGEEETAALSLSPTLNMVLDINIQ